MQVTLSTASLKAALLMAAVRDVRYYLNGVHVRSDAEGFVWIEATDGHALYQDRATELHAGPRFAVTIPSDIVKMATGNKAPAVLYLERNEAVWMLSNIKFEPVDGKFPPFARVIPQQPSGEVGQFDCDLLALAQKALRISQGKKGAVYTLQHNGERGALMRPRDTMWPLTVIMPMNPRTLG